MATAGVPEQSLPVGTRLGQLDKLSFVRLAGSEKVLVLSDPDGVGIAAALISAVSGALGGWVGGAGGYARAGGDEMIPLGSTIQPRGPRQGPRRKPR